jgi:hypothetical protein
MGPLFVPRISDGTGPLIFASGVVRDPILIPADFWILRQTNYCEIAETRCCHGTGSTIIPVPLLYVVARVPALLAAGTNNGNRFAEGASMSEGIGESGPATACGREGRIAGPELR